MSAIWRAILAPARLWLRFWRAVRFCLYLHDAWRKAWWKAGRP